MRSSQRDASAPSGTVKSLAPGSLANNFTFNFTGANDQLIIDSANTNPIPPGGITYNGGSTTNGNVLLLLATNTADTIVVNGGAILFNGKTINFSNTGTVQVDPRKGSDSLTVNATAVTLPAQISGNGILARQFANLTVAAAASITVTDSTAHSDRTVLVASNLSIAPTAKLDLAGNDLIVRNGSLTALAALLSSGFSSGTWIGNGITSSDAHNNPRSITALGSLQNNTGGSIPIYSIFDGQSAFATDVLIKYTYYGDADLSGKVDGTDYSAIDASIGKGLTTWATGNFDFNAVIDGSDYSLIDNAFNTQSSRL